MTVKRYELENGLIQLTGTVTQQSEVHERFSGTHDVVLASDYDALAAEHQSLKNLWHANAGALRLSEIGVRELEAALRQLHHECLEAGFGTAKDYNWPKSMRDAASALETKGDPGGS